MALRMEEAFICMDGSGRRYQVEVWRKVVQDQSGADREVLGLREAWVVDPPPRRRLNPIEGDQAFRIVGEDTILRPVRSS